MSAKPRTRMALLPAPAHLSQAEAKLVLKDQVFKDALAAGWLRECARKGGGGSVYYATSDVMDVSLRIAGGEYPEPRDDHALAGAATNDGRRAA